MSEALLAVLEGVRLVSRQFRKRRLALWAAGRGPDPYFTAMAVLEGVRLFLGSSESDVWHYIWAAGRGPDPYFTGVLALRDRSLSEALLAVLEGVRLVSRQFRKRRLALWAAGRGPDPYFTAMHGVLALRDRSLSEALLAVLEGVKLVSRQFRKRRLALWAAGRGPDPYFTAMVFWPCETGL